MAFTEWILFEWQYEHGKTLLELYLERRGDVLPAGARERLRQVAVTQFFSRFKIARKDVETGVLTLIDERTGRCYDVVDSSAVEVEHWRDGVLAERIACVDGTWICVGQLHLYDIAPSTVVRSEGPGAAGAGGRGMARSEGPGAVRGDGAGTVRTDGPEAEFVDDQGAIHWEGLGKARADGPGALREEDLAGGLANGLPSFYLRLVRDVMGANGRYSSTLNAYRNNEDPTGVYLDDPSD